MRLDSWPGMQVLGIPAVEVSVFTLFQPSAEHTLHVPNQVLHLARRSSACWRQACRRPTESAQSGSVRHLTPQAQSVPNISVRNPKLNRERHAGVLRAPGL